MTRRKTDKESIRNIQTSRGSYMVSIPLSLVRKLGWRKRQKVVVAEKRGRLTISDWKK